MHLVPESEKWFLAGVEAHLKFRKSFQEAKTAMLDSGLYFASAKAACKHGTWEEYADAIIKTRNLDISLRSIRRYMAFAEQMIEWVRQSHPGIKADAKIRQLAQEQIILSPIEVIAICREVGLMRRFGEYDTVKHQERKAKAEDAEQLMFAFEVACSQLKAITKAPQHLADLAPSSLVTLEQELQSALSQVQSILSTKSTKSTDTTLSTERDPVLSKSIGAPALATQGAPMPHSRKS